MDLSTIFSKTPKGLRARASLIGGLSAHLMKVLSHVDGSSKAETILLKFDKLTPQQLSADLTRLVQEGYIRLATVTSATDDSWALTVNFEPMVVEEYQSEEELEAIAQAKKAEQTRQAEQLQAEQLAKQAEERRLAAQLKAEKKAQKLHAKAMSKAEAKVKAVFAQEIIAQEAEKAARIQAEAEAKIKAQQEAARKAEQQAADRAAKLAEEMARKAALKAREAAEQAEADAEEKAKQHAHREIERISREAEEAQKKADAEAKAIADAKVKQELERLEALNLAKAAEDARQAQLKAQAELQAQLAQAEKEAAEQKRHEAEAAVALERQLQADKAAQAAALEEALAHEEKERARLEIANVLRKAEDDRKNAVAQAKAEKLEAKRQAKAEQDARLQAERQVKEAAKELAKQQKLAAQAEEKAKAEAKDQARREAARMAKEAEMARKKALEAEQLQAKQAADALAAQAEHEKTQRLKGEKQAQLAAEAVRASLAAEEQANVAAKQKSQLEMERIGREAELVRQKTAQQHKVAEEQEISVPQYLPEIENVLPDKAVFEVDDFDASEAAEEAAFEAEEQAAEAKIQHREISADVAAPSAGVNHVARRKAVGSRYDFMQIFVATKKIWRWLGSVVKMALIYVPILVLVLLALLHFINLRALINPIEQLASESVGQPVEITKVHASLWPQPHLVLENVVIGAVNKIDAVHVLPETASLFEDVKVVKSLVIEGLNIEQANFSQPLQWASNASKSKTLKIEQINLENLTLTIRDLHLGSFDGKVMLTDTGALSSIALVSSNNALSVTISPQDNDSEIVLKATNWTLPFDQKIMFDALNATGLVSQNQIKFSQIEGEIFGGGITGQAHIAWPSGASQWLSAGQFKLTNANAEGLLNKFGSAVMIDGKLALQANFSGQAREANKLADTMTTNTNFEVRQGRIQGVALARAVLSPGRHSLAGSDTQFDKLTGSLKINQKQCQFGRLLLASSQLNANGFININANQIVTGRVTADLVAQSRRLKANFGVNGRGKDLKSY